jgi:hypothetical protein
MNTASNDPEPELFEAVYDLLQRTFREVRDERGRGYNAGYSYKSIHQAGAGDAVSRSILKARTDGFGRIEEAGRLDLSYEWFSLDPRWHFSEEVRRRAWDRLNVALKRQARQA